MIAPVGWIRRLGVCLGETISPVRGGVFRSAPSDDLPSLANGRFPKKRRGDLCPT